MNYEETWSMRTTGIKIVGFYQDLVIPGKKIMKYDQYYYWDPTQNPLSTPWPPQLAPYAKDCLTASSLLLQCFIASLLIYTITVMVLAYQVCSIEQRVLATSIFNVGFHASGILVFTAALSNWADKTAAFSDQLASMSWLSTRTIILTPDYGYGLAWISWIFTIILLAVMIWFYRSLVPPDVPVEVVDKRELRINNYLNNYMNSTFYQESCPMGNKLDRPLGLELRREPINPNP